LPISLGVRGLAPARGVRQPPVGRDPTLCRRPDAHRVRCAAHVHPRSHRRRIRQSRPRVRRPRGDRSLAQPHHPSPNRVLSDPCRWSPEGPAGSQTDDRSPPSVCEEAQPGRIQRRSPRLRRECGRRTPRGTPRPVTPRTHVPSMGDARSPEATQLALPGVVESLSHRYVRSGPDLVHEIVVGRRTFTSSIRLESTDPTDDLLGAWWKAYLRGVRPDTNARGPAVRVAELFCASGGLVLGVDQAARELELGVRSIAAVDQDEEALAIYRRHNSTSVTTTKSVSTLVDYRVRGQGEDCTFVYEPELVDPEWSDLVGSIDVLLAGPPCQGHSNLNNRTRRNDERNALYLTVPAIGVALRAPIVVIENVQAVVHDRKQVVQSAIALLERAGYSVTTHVLRAAELGWPQRRQRFFVVARRDRPPLPLTEVSRVFSAEPRDLWWAIGDLEHHDSDHFMDQQPELSEENRRRIDWLFDNDEYDLALDQRPT